MFEMTPAVEWLERDYDTLTALEYEEYPEMGTYAGLRRFEARGRWDSYENECIGLMFSFKFDDTRKPMTWTANPSRRLMAWDGPPLDDEVRWL